jgi:hypothetical protein
LYVVVKPHLQSKKIGMFVIHGCWPRGLPAPPSCSPSARPRCSTPEAPLNGRAVSRARWAGRAMRARWAGPDPGRARGRARGRCRRCPAAELRASGRDAGRAAGALRHGRTGAGHGGRRARAGPGRAWSRATGMQPPLCGPRCAVAGPGSERSGRAGRRTRGGQDRARAVRGAAAAAAPPPRCWPAAATPAARGAHRVCPLPPLPPASGYVSRPESSP